MKNQNASSFQNSIDPLNFSFMDEVFVPVNLDEQDNYCPICQSKINSSCSLSHPNDFHKFTLYKDINKRMQEKNEIIEKNLRDIADLKWYYHSFTQNYVFKPSKPNKLEHRNNLFQTRKILCEYLNKI